MSVLTIAIVGGGIATGFYYINRDTARSQKKLRDSTAMVFILSTVVLLVARFFGLGGDSEVAAPGSSPVVRGAKTGGAYATGGLSPVKAVPLDYVIGGEPPF